jgi:hypothetical protein
VVRIHLRLKVRNCRISRNPKQPFKAYANSASGFAQDSPDGVIDDMRYQYDFSMSKGALDSGFLYDYLMGRGG